MALRFLVCISSVNALITIKPYRGVYSPISEYHILITVRLRRLQFRYRVARNLKDNHNGCGKESAQEYFGALQGGETPVSQFLRYRPPRLRW